MHTYAYTHKGRGALVTINNQGRAAVMMGTLSYRCVLGALTSAATSSRELLLLRAAAAYGGW